MEKQPFPSQKNNSQIYPRRAVSQLLYVVYNLGHIWEAMRVLCVDVFLTSECFHLYILCIVPQCLFRELYVM